jgi:hypothetical protein
MCFRINGEKLFVTKIEISCCFVEYLERIFGFVVVEVIEWLRTRGMAGVDHQGKRRRRQRFVAKRWGSVCFWVVIDGQRLPAE